MDFPGRSPGSSHTGVSRAEDLSGNGSGECCPGKCDREAYQVVNLAHIALDTVVVGFEPWVV